MKRKRRQRRMVDNAEKATRSVSKSKPVTIKIDRDLIDRVMARVAGRNLRQAQMVRYLCEEFLTRPEDEGLAKIIDAIEKHERAQALLQAKQTRPSRKKN
jgi:hypothetical protein